MPRIVSSSAGSVGQTDELRVVTSPEVRFVVDKGSPWH